jgi:cellulose synthase/poly-beta-1,6-N-acetylglucosamine synthase-like glycosyltransferase
MLPTFDWNTWQIGFFALCLLAWLVQVIYLFRYLWPVARIRPAETAGKPVPVSVVISARNEEKNLMEHIPAIMDQRHPEFEVIVVNDSSWDDTEAILKALEVRYPRLRVIHLDEEKQNMQGKKFALTLAIKAARYEHILLTDADCIPASEDWISQMAAGFSEEKEIVLGFSPYTRESGWLNRLIRFDTLLIGLQYLGFARRGNPYMGVGRNLAYRKDVFFRVGGFRNHYRLASGDDDLFINQVANRKNTAVVVHREAQTESAPKKTRKDWFAQKRRHLTTAPHYKAEHRNLLALWPFSFFLLWAGFAGSLVVNAGVWIVGGLLLSRYMAMLVILRATSRKLRQPADTVWMAPLLEIHLHLINAGLYAANLLRKPQKWN